MKIQQQHTAFVTGATGFLGHHICQQLSQQGWTVYALCRSQDKAQDLSGTCHIIIGDVLSTDLFTSQLPAGIDAIFHIAASTNTWFKNNALQTQTNLQGTQNIMDLANKHQVKRFIHISSVVVYGIHDTLKYITEDMPKAGKGSWINYVNTKTASEELVLKNKNLESVIINPTHIIGPGDRHNWARLIKMIAQQKLPSIPNGAGSFVDVRDVANGAIAAFHHGRSGENYLLGGTDMNFKKFVNAVADALNVKATRTQLPNSLLMLLARIKNLISKITNKEPDITPESVTLISDLYGCDSAKAKSELNYQNRDFQQTLTDTLNYLRAEHII